MMTQFSDNRFVRNPLVDANHHIWNSDVSREISEYQSVLRKVCFNKQPGVFREKPLFVAKKKMLIPPFRSMLDDFFYSNHEEAMTNRHLFDARGDNVLRIVDEDFKIYWTNLGRACEIDASNQDCASFTSVLCHKERDVAVLIDFDGRIVALDFKTGKLFTKSEKILGENFASPSIAWYNNSAIALATGQQAFLYDIVSEEKTCVFKISEKIKTIAPCLLESAGTVAVHYENSGVDFFDVRQPNVVLYSLQCNATSIDWHPSTNRLAVVHDGGKIAKFNMSLRLFEPLLGLPTSVDTTGVFWNDQNSLYLTSSQENGLDRVDYYCQNQNNVFCNDFQWSTKSDLLCARADRSENRLYMCTNEQKIYCLELPPPPIKRGKKMPNQSALVCHLR